MNNINSRLKYLFNAYYDKTATEQERAELFKLIETLLDQELEDLLQQRWKYTEIQDAVFEKLKSEEIFDNILSRSVDGKPDANRPYFFSWINFFVAATVLLLLSIGTYYYVQQNSSHVKPQIIAKTKPQLHDALPGGNKAILKLSNGKTIVLNNAGNGTLAKIGNIRIDKARDGQLVYHISKDKSGTENYSFNTISTPKGGQYQVVLPDGTKVWLNAASSLSFPTRFTGNTRNVELTGEAYFEVTKNPSMPFNVKSARAEVEVLGTHFNIMAYHDEAEMKTTLLEGAVKIKSKNITNILKPGQQASVNESGQQSIDNGVDVDKVIAWKNGIFQFDDAGIDVIMRQAARWYDVNVSYEGKIAKKRFTGSISKNVKASVLLSMLQYTGVNFRIEGKNIIVTN